MNLLIVDDHLTNLELLRAQLEAEGHAVFEAHDGVEALELLDRQQVDVAISDILMPRMDGYRLCHEIRTNTRLRNLPIIIYTCTYASPRDEKLALELGADKYLKKPASIETIVAALHEVIAMPHTTPRPEALREVEVLKEYSERLVAKLEERNTELSAAVERYDDLFDNAHDLIQSLTPDGHFLYVNRTWCETLGHTEAEAPGLTMFDILHPDSRTHCLELLQRVFSGEHIERIEATLTTKTGHTIVVEGSINCKVVEGKVVAVRCLFRDITERKQAEAETLELAERLTSTLESLTDGFFTIDREWRFTYVNRAAEQMFKLPRAELLGNHIWAKFPEARDTISQQQYERAVWDNVAVQFETFYPPLGIWFDARAFPSAQGLAVYFRDITAIRQAGEALRVSEERFRSYFELGLIGMAITSPTKGCLEVNNQICQILGYERSELLQMSWAKLTHTDDLPADVANFNRVLAGDCDSYTMDKRFIRKDGQVVHATISVKCLRRADGSVDYLVALLQDITGRRLSEAALEKAHQELVAASRQAGMAEVATGVLHNVGNVLNSVNVASTCVADRLKKSKTANLLKVVALMREHEGDLGTFLTSDPKGKQLPGYLAQLAGHLAGEQATALKELAGLQKNIEHIKDIVSMQQSFSKVSCLMETLHAADLVEDALRMNSSSFARHDIQVIKEFENVPPVTVEKHKVLQILVNLVRNAKHACDDSGRQEKRLTIRVSQQGEAACITVSDNGIGIPPENLTRIFAHGFTTKTNGHGFGLHSSALAAKELGGSLSASSDGPDRGATFILELPLKHESKGLLCTT
jgi:PAS domain S-box-containing protein